MNSSSNSRDMGSVDLDPAQQDFLDLPSPYHDSFTPHDAPSLISTGVPNSLFKSFFHRFRYSRVNSDAEHLAKTQTIGRENGNEDNDDESLDEEVTRRKRKKHVRWSDYEETPADRWFTVVFLLLLLSALFNLFLVFNGPPNTIPRHPKPKDNPLPHKGFHFYEHGKNYTCYETHNSVFKANYEFSNIFGAYDYLWSELLGGSKGVIYTSLSREDKKIRRAGLAMFHQLDCLAKLRSVIQALQDGIREKDIVDVGEHHGYWPHCFDYLRQVILCNADDSVESSEVFEGRWVSSGFGDTKECRDASWLYDITNCGEGGCAGKAFYHSPEQLNKIHMEEEGEVEKWRKDHKDKLG